VVVLVVCLVVCLIVCLTVCLVVCLIDASLCIGWWVWVDWGEREKG